MHTVNIDFVPFDEMSFGQVLKGVGVYVIWKRQAQGKPSYIGKGDILDRLSKHDDRFASVDGYVGLLGTKDRKADDQDSCIVEALLLGVASQTDRWPTHNVKDGHWRTVDRAHRLHGLVRVGVCGCDPFGPPDAPRRLAQPKYIRYRINAAGEGTIDHDWNLRKRLQPRNQSSSIWDIFS